MISYPRCMLRGSLGLAVVSVAAFSVWAFGGKWLETRLGEPGLYSACAIVFLCGAGLLLHQLVPGGGSFLRFYLVFVPAFFAYTVVWCAAWFCLRFGSGEWLGSLLGTLAFTATAGWRFRNYNGFLNATAVLFIFHSAGYFAGGQAMRSIMSPHGSALLAGLTRQHILLVAKLSWGLLYGLGFGAGIGYAFHKFQLEKAGARPARKKQD